MYGPSWAGWACWAGLGCLGCLGCVRCPGLPPLALLDRAGWAGLAWAGLGSLGSLGGVWCPGLAWLALLGRALVPRPPRGEKNTFFGERPRRRPAKNAKAQDFPSDFTGPKKLVVGLASFRQNRSANL